MLITSPVEPLPNPTTNWAVAGELVATVVAIALRREVPADECEVSVLVLPCSFDRLPISKRAGNGCSASWLQTLKGPADLNSAICPASKVVGAPLGGAGS